MGVVMMVLAGVVAAQDAAPPAAQLRVVTPGGKPVVGIVRNLQHAPDVDGSHSSDFEAENGIQFQFSGSQGATGGANMVGHYRSGANNNCSLMFPVSVYLYLECLHLS
ncbi:putative Cuticle protein AMP4-like 2 [Homarus americanus]|uniref:Putative Cuticle protein AMP4-like 2 n=1 Tax=Homarus americanus TaxID=6706 RepID=A0A8J5N9Y4_HOMAM|nr:putative Cuticle protein AMP4-like 2 [Homarus americanus]